MRSQPDTESRNLANVVPEGEDARAANGTNAPKVTQGRTQERGWDESAKTNGFATLWGEPTKSKIKGRHDMLNMEKAKPIESKPTVNKISRRIGSTTYRVNVHFSETSKENMQDKMLRLIKNDGGK